MKVHRTVLYFTSHEPQRGSVTPNESSTGLYQNREPKLTAEVWLGSRFVGTLHRLISLSGLMTESAFRATGWPARGRRANRWWSELRDPPNHSSFHPPPTGIHSTCRGQINMQQHAGKEEGTSAAFGYNTWTSVETVWVWQKIFSYQPLTGSLPYRPPKSDPLIDSFRTTTTLMMPCSLFLFFFSFFFWWKNEKSSSLDPVLWGLKQTGCKKPHISHFSIIFDPS